MRFESLGKFGLILCLAAMLSACGSANEHVETDDRGCGTSVVEVSQRTYDSDTGGCGDFSAYQFNQSGTEAISVSLDRELLGLSKNGHYRFDLSQSPEGVLVEINRYSKSASDEYCNDVLSLEPAELLQRWVANQGEIIIDMVSDPSTMGDSYQVIIEFKNVVAREVSDAPEDVASSPETIHVTDMILGPVHVGWYPG